jgi:UDP-2-acetamido-3-amino-2,3-dideoxy-glucuronate N-acetyltransferase
VVTQDVPPHAIVAGNPAQVIGYVSPPGIESASQPVVQVAPPAEAGAIQLIGGASLIRFPEVIDLRGKLAFAEVGDLLPFEVKRFFFVYGVPTTSIRGEHAHRRIHQLLICASGTLRVSLTDGTERREVLLQEPSVGLHLPPMVWAAQYRHQPSTCLLALCSDKYESDEYIRDFDDFTELTR